jgi:hypothetical protein
MSDLKKPELETKSADETLVMQRFLFFEGGTGGGCSFEIEAHCYKEAYKKAVKKYGNCVDNMWCKNLEVA